MKRNVAWVLVLQFLIATTWSLGANKALANNNGALPNWTEYSASRKAKFGRPFSGGATPDQSVRSALDPQTQVRLTSSYRFAHRSKISLSYDYLINGIKVEQAFVKAIVELEHPHRIHLLQVQAPTSIRAQGKPAPHKIPAKGAELIYLLDEASGQAALVYKVKSIGGTLAEPENFLSFYEASTGKLLKRESLVHHHSAQAEVLTFANEGLNPFLPNNPGVLQPVPNAMVQVSSPSFIDPRVTDATGRTNFEINTNSATLVVSLSNPILSVLNTPGWGQPQSVLRRSLTRNLPGQFLLELPGNSGDEISIAQSNAFIKTNATYQWLRSRAPDFTALDEPLTAHVNIPSSCNAYYTEGSINFFASSTTCPNTAYSTVIAHEFGHFVVESLGLFQGSFGEGYSDLLAMMIFETPSIGHGFFRSSPQPLRRPGIDIIEYPCDAAIHYCGQTLAGTFWQLRENILQSVNNVELANQLFVDWTLSTGGGIGLDSAHPLTAVEVLVLNDKDGIIENGSPERQQICDAFRSRGIYCPELNLFEINLLTVHTNTQTPGVHQNVRIAVSPRFSELASSAKVVYRVNEGPWTTKELSPNSGNEFFGSLPVQSCGAKVDYFVEVKSESQLTQLLPAAPEFLTTFAAVSSVTLANLDFSEVTDAGWEAIPVPTGTRQWIRRAPNDFYYPTHDADGSNAFWIDGVYGEWWADGPTKLRTPGYRVQGDFFRVSYARLVRAGPFSPTGEFKALFTENGGAPVELERFDGSTNGWQRIGFTRTTTSRGTDLTFEFWHTRQPEVDSVAAFDSFQLTSFSCQTNSNPSIAPSALHWIRNQSPLGCVADFNRDRIVDENDLAMFLEAYSTQQESADLNGDGEVTQLDYILFIERYNEGCF